MLLFPRRALVLVLLLATVALPSARAQDSTAPPADTSAAPRPPALDRELLLDVHRADGLAVRVAMRTADYAAYPLFYGAPVAAWGAALLGDDGGYGDAYRLALAEGLALATTLALKKAFGRPRPYHTLPSVHSRSERYNRRREGFFVDSFPSGHAALSFALATSWSLSHPAWYVIGPSFAGAALIATSRLWLGVHYPSDVLAGALLGAGLAVGVHLLRGALTPDALEADDAPSGPMLRLRVPLP